VKIDDSLSFTYATEQVMDEDEPVGPEMFVGHFELNMTHLMEDDQYIGPEWTDDSSFRFCLQMYPKYNSDGTLKDDGQNSEKAERYRMRFFNKAASEFTFYPQVAYPYKLEDS